MVVRGIVRTAELDENPPESGNIEIVVQVQGVGPGQPRRLVLPMPLLLEDPDLNPESLVGRPFQAEVEPGSESPGRWVVLRLALGPARVLRPPES